MDNKIINEYETLLRENHVFADIIEITENKIVASIIWGDWKHDHARFDYLTETFFEKRGYSVFITKRSTQEDGSDCYSADHIVTLKKEREIVQEPRKLTQKQQEVVDLITSAYNLDWYEYVHTEENVDDYVNDLENDEPMSIDTALDCVAEAVACDRGELAIQSLEESDITILKELIGNFEE